MTERTILCGDLTLEGRQVIVEGHLVAMTTACRQWLIDRGVCLLIASPEVLKNLVRPKAGEANVQGIHTAVCKARQSVVRNAQSALCPGAWQCYLSSTYDYDTRVALAAQFCSQEIRVRA